jgi:thiol-disulfide isomerase/thioredoxin
MRSRSQPRVRAPQLTGRGWLNTGGRSLDLETLKGRVVLLDFWTFCCINCLHVLDELRPLEAQFGDDLVVIGVHSPKFEHEKDAVALAAAVERYGVEHPVLDDPEMTTWRSYAARAWPTLVLIDPEGYVVLSMAGEGHGPGLAGTIEDVIDEHRQKGTLASGGSFYVAEPEPTTALRFPAKALRLESSWLVTSASQHQLVELADDRETVLRRIGSGLRGRDDGASVDASFSEPQGLCALPPEVADRVGYDIIVADTVNHLLRGVRLDDGSVQTIAGTGDQWRRSNDTQAALHVDLSSPWDVAWFEDRVIIAMAGIHQLWWFDPISSTADVYAGTTTESLRDGRLDYVFMAQPSGLSVAGDRLWLVDSETSALRWVQDGVMHTAVGQGLFDFGSIDGPASRALLQHPLGLHALPNGTVFVADTYNGSIRKYDSITNTVSTVATGLGEPSDVFVDDNEDSLFVVESTRHRLAKLSHGTDDAGRPDVAYKIEREPTALQSGDFLLDVVFTAPAGQKLDESFGPPTQLEVSASPAELIVEGAGTSTRLERHLVLSSAIETGTLQITAQAATCDEVGEHPACHLIRQDWGIPVVLTREGESRIELMLRGQSA